MSMTKKDLQMKQLRDREAQTRALRDYMNDPHHRLPKSRRDFLTAGVQLLATTALIPSLSQLISTSAWAAECEGSAPSTNLPPAYINIQLAGGAALFANYMVQGSAGAPMKTPSAMGMGNAPRLDTFFANQAPFWYELDPLTAIPSSGMIRGLLNSVPKSDAIFSQTAFIAIAAESLDDTNKNKNDITGLLAAAGLAGSTLPYLTTGWGNSLAETAAIPGNNFDGVILPPATMLKVATGPGLQSSVTPKGAFSLVPDTTKLMKAIEDLSKYQVDALLNAPNSTESKRTLAELIQCSTEKNYSVIQGAGVVDFMTNPTTYDGGKGTQYKTIWTAAPTATTDELISKGLTTDNMTAILARTGLAVVNCLKGFSAAATINMGGYDYHASQYQRFSATMKDQFFGDVIGRILQSAKIANRKVFIHVSSDGSVGSSPSATTASTNWTGENQKRAMNYILAYDPTKTGGPTVQGFKTTGYEDKSYQLNHFDETTGTVRNDGDPIASATSGVCGLAVFLNYLNFAGLQDLLNTKPELAQAKATLAATPNYIDRYSRIKAGG